MAEKPKKDCFVVGPIGPPDSDKRIHTEWVLDAIINPVLQAAGFSVHHPLRMPKPGLIDTQVITHLLNADLVIADLTTQNANAFYEIGIRHMAQKPIIHMHKLGEEIPFDLSLYRSIEFSFARPRDLDTAKANLKEAVEAVMAADYKVDNPVTHARGVVQIQEATTDPNKVLLDEIKGLKERLTKMERGSSAGLIDSGLKFHNVAPHFVYLDVDLEDPPPLTEERIAKMSGTELAEAVIQQARRKRAKKDPS